MIYLASPYSHFDPARRQSRYEQIMAVTAKFLAEGHHVYSPIVHCHPLSLAHILPGDFAFWQSYNIHMLGRAQELWVVQLEGWQESKGVEEEIIHALRAAKPVLYFDFEGVAGGEDSQYSGNQL